MTLYIFTPDPLNSSVCYEMCAELWPPLLVRSADSIVAGDGLPGELGVIERTTGTMQVTCDILPTAKPGGFYRQHGCGANPV